MPAHLSGPACLSQVSAYKCGVSDRSKSRIRRWSDSSSHLIFCSEISVSEPHKRTLAQSEPRSNFMNLKIDSLCYTRDMHIQVPHKSSKTQALIKVKEAIDGSRSQLGGYATIDQERWDGDTLHFSATLQGKTISGTLQVTDVDFIVDAKLPLLWRMFEGRIEKMIAEQAKSLE